MVDKLFPLTILFSLLGSLLFSVSVAVAHGQPTETVTDPSGIYSDVAQIRVDGGQVHYDGWINKFSLDKLKSELASHQGIVELVIKSNGGLADAGLEFGEIVRDRHLIVRVERGCVSACANYVAVAATSLYVPDDALLVYHGGVPKTFDDTGHYSADHVQKLRSLGLSDQDIVRQLELDQALYAREVALYRSIGVSRYLLLDSEQPRSIIRDSQHDKNYSEAPIYMFTREALESCYNLRNVKSYPDLEPGQRKLGERTLTIVGSCKSRSQTPS